MSSSGKGQSVVRGPGDVDGAWELARTGARVNNDRVIVEGFVDFDYEITLLTVRAVDPATGALATYFCDPIGHRQVDGDYVESWQPQPMSPAAYDISRSIAARVVTAMGDGELGGRGVFGVELFVKGDEVYFSEVSLDPTTPVCDPGVAAVVGVRVARPCGTGTAGDHRDARARGIRGDLRAARGHRDRVRRCRRRPRRSGRRSALVR